MEKKPARTRDRREELELAESGSYLWKLARQWWFWLGGVLMVVGLVELFASRWADQLPWWSFFVVGALLVFLAQYQIWRGARDAHREEVGKLRQRQADLRSELASAESLKGEAERRYLSLLEGRFEVGPGLEVLSESPETPAHFKSDPVTKSFVERLSGPQPTHSFHLLVRYLVTPSHSSIYLWASAPIYKVAAMFNFGKDGERSQGVIRPRRRRNQWVEICAAGFSPKAEDRVLIVVESFQPIALRRVALESEPEPLTAIAETQDGPGR